MYFFVVCVLVILCSVLLELVLNVNTKYITIAGAVIIALATSVYLLFGLYEMINLLDILMNDYNMSAFREMRIRVAYISSFASLLATLVYLPMKIFKAGGQDVTKWVDISYITLLCIISGLFVSVDLHQRYENMAARSSRMAFESSYKEDTSSGQGVSGDEPEDK